MICKNCKSNLSNIEKYCNQCGAKVVTQRLEIWTLLSNWLETIFNIDNKFLATIFHLFYQPQEVMVGYVEGLRKKYLPPINYLIVALGVYGIFVVVAKDSGYFYEEVLLGIYRVEMDGFDFDQIKTIRFLNFPILLSQVPIFALVAMWVFGKKYNFAEHLIIISYWISHIMLIALIISLFSIMVGISADSQGIVISTFILVYTFLVHRKVYHLRWLLQIFKYFIFLFLGIVSIVIYCLILGYFLLAGIDA